MQEKAHHHNLCATDVLLRSSLALAEGILVPRGRDPFGQHHDRDLWEGSGRVQFSEHAQSNRFAFLANQICYRYILREPRSTREIGFQIC